MGTFIDQRDGKAYKTVEINGQIWMAENLAFTIPCCPFGKFSKYGRLYTWWEALNVAPDGWHLPSKEEWQKLIDFCGGEKIAGTRLKVARDWNPCGGIPIGTDDYGFAALPCGGNDGSVFGIDFSGLWWSACEYDNLRAYRLGMSYSSEGVGYYGYDKSFFFSVRCLKNKTSRVSRCLKFHSKIRNYIAMEKNIKPDTAHKCFVVLPIKYTDLKAENKPELDAAIYAWFKDFLYLEPIGLESKIAVDEANTYTLILNKDGEPPFERILPRYTYYGMEGKTVYVSFLSSDLDELLKKFNPHHMGIVDLPLSVDIKEILEAVAKTKITLIHSFKNAYALWRKLPAKKDEVELWECLWHPDKPEPFDNVMPKLIRIAESKFANPLD